MEDTAEEYVVSRMTSSSPDDVTAHDEVIIDLHGASAARDGDVIDVASERKNEGTQEEYEDILDDLPQIEDAEHEKKVKWEDSDGNF